MKIVNIHKAMNSKINKSTAVINTLSKTENS